jgi:hypothetical protein
MNPLAPVTNIFFIRMIYLGNKGTIKREKKQKNFDFSEREYLRPWANDTIKREKKQKNFDFSERKYLR